MNNYRSYVVVVISLAIFGCTTKYTSTPADKVIGGYTGIIYSLPMLQYEIVTTRQIRKCASDHDASGLDIAGRVDISAQYLADPYATFQLDYTEMSKLTGTSELEIQLTEDSRLKSINSMAKDETAEILKNSFSILSNVALANAKVAGIVPSAFGGISLKYPQCSDMVKAVFSELSKTNKVLLTLTSHVAFLSSEVGRLTLIIASVGATEPVISELNETSKQLRTATRKLETLTISRKPYIDKITYTEKIQWPRSSGDSLERANMPEDEVLTMEMPNKVLKDWWGNYDETHSNDVGLALLSKVNFSLNLLRLTDTVANVRPEPETSGVIYRYPVDVQLQVCSGLVCDRNSVNIIEKRVHRSPQHGPYASLPFENRAFQNTTLNVEFGDNGVPSSLTFKSEKAALAEASAAFSDSASQLPGLQQQLLGAKLQSLKRATELAEQTAKLNAAEAALLPSAISDQIAQKTILEAEVALLNSEIAKVVATKE